MMLCTAVRPRTALWLVNHCPLSSPSVFYVSEILFVTMSVTIPPVSTIITISILCEWDAVTMSVIGQPLSTWSPSVCYMVKVHFVTICILIYIYIYIYRYRYRYICYCQPLSTLVKVHFVTLSETGFFWLHLPCLIGQLLSTLVTSICCIRKFILLQHLWLVNLCPLVVKVHFVCDWSPFFSVWTFVSLSTQGYHPFSLYCDS